MRAASEPQAPRVLSGDLLKLLPVPVPPPVGSALQKVLQWDQLDNLYEDARRAPGDGPFCEKLLRLLNVHVDVEESDEARIPLKGPVLVVANHPFGMIEGIILIALLTRLRPDTRCMANQMLVSIAELQEHLILVDPFQRPETFRTNQRGLKDALRWLNKGGLVVIFPGGEVSHLDVQHRGITDRAWSPTTGRIARISGASVLPVYFQGVNSVLFHLAGLIHPMLRTAMLPRELLNKHDRTIQLFVGSPVRPRQVAAMGSDTELTEYLRRRTYLMANRRRPALLPLPLPRPWAAGKPTVAAVEKDLLEAETGALPGRCELVSSGDYRVYAGSLPEMPNTVREICRLREVTFRAVGEGTGKPLDMDSFDAHYLHLFVWNKASREVVGAYRLGDVQAIRARFGIRGLYTRTLFSYGPELLDRLGESVEMGRSFVRPEYQKNYNALLLLWRGIGRFLAANPRIHTLFGPVSISNDYSGASRQLMVRYLSEQSQRTDLASLVKPRSPFRSKRVKGWDGVSHAGVVSGLDELSTLVADIEKDQKGLPVLLRQYLKLGGKLAGFNVDAAFSKTLDGLIFVDLRETDPSLLERYLGREGVAAFQTVHGVSRAWKGHRPS